MGALVMTVARVVVPIMAVAVATTRLGTVAKSAAARRISQAMTKKGRQPCTEIDVELRVAPDVVEGFQETVSGNLSFARPEPEPRSVRLLCP